MISKEHLTEIGQAVANNLEMTQLRCQFPGVHFTVCEEDDIIQNIAPVAECGDYHLYLVAGADGHCLTLTSDETIATGVVLAHVVAEE